MSVGNPVSLPQASARLVDRNGFPTREFYRFFQSLASTSQANSSAAAIAALQAAVAQLQEEIDSLPAGHYPTLQAIFPLVSDGLLQNGFAQLVWQGTTDDVPEGSTNEYFTDQRAEDAVGSILDGTGNVPLTYSGGDIHAALNDTGVTPGVYGDGSHIPQITVDVNGRITNIVLINIDNTTFAILCENDDFLSLEAGGHILGTT